MKFARWMILLSLSTATAVAIGCEQEGPMEETGEALDEAVEETGEAVDEAGEDVEDMGDGT